MLRSKDLYFYDDAMLSLKGLVRGKSVLVEASGLPDFVIEIGEQLAWLGAALRSSPIDDGVVHCTPYVDQTVLPDDKKQDIKCTVKYDIDICDTQSRGGNGKCWHYLFANPVIAHGFPVPQRGEVDTGLEAPLDMLIELSGARYIDTFKSKVFIKGFSTMLVPTKRSDNMIIWHLLYKSDPGERISYLDCSIEHADIGVTDLEECRHVLGWCRDVVSIVGTTQAAYDIGKSGLPYTHSRCTLEKAEISAGQFVTGTAAFAFGNREKPVHISRFGYLTKLQWISSKYFVFWDEKDKRGWLVNGASALLHILRASLEHSKRKFQSVWLLDPSALCDATNPSRPDSALEVLVNMRNRDLELYLDRTEVYDEETRDGQTNNTVSRRQTRHNRLEDRIEHIYNILEKLIDQRTDAERRPGLHINPRLRKYLEGWGFNDIVMDGDPFFSRVATLQTIGKGWVDFTRGIHAVTLFGRDFGELFQPQQTTENPPCPSWSILPSQKYYLAACVSDLQDIMDKYGDSTSNPRHLCDNVIWHMNEAAFISCPCTKGMILEHYDPVQVLFPLKFMQKLQRNQQVELQNRGAVIFGHNINLHWHWKDTGDPVKGDPPPKLGATQQVFHDSGFGPSLSPPYNGSNQSSTTASFTASDNPSPGKLLSPRSSLESTPENASGSSKRRLQNVFSSFRKMMKC